MTLHTMVHYPFLFYFLKPDQITLHWMTTMFVFIVPNTPLHLASFAGNFIIVEHLLSIGVDLRAQTIDHKTAIELALEMQRSAVIDVFERSINSNSRYMDYGEEFELIKKRYYKV